MELKNFNCNCAFSFSMYTLARLSDNCNYKTQYRATFRPANVRSGIRIIPELDFDRNDILCIVGDLSLWTVNNYVSHKTIFHEYIDNN